MRAYHFSIYMLLIVICSEPLHTPPWFSGATAHTAMVQWSYLCSCRVSILLVHVDLYVGWDIGTILDHYFFRVTSNFDTSDPQFTGLLLLYHTLINNSQHLFACLIIKPPDIFLSWLTELYEDKKLNSLKCIKWLQINESGSMCVCAVGLPSFHLHSSKRLLRSIIS